jgi:hypothetical protein
MGDTTTGTETGQAGDGTTGQAGSDQGTQTGQQTGQPAGEQPKDGDVSTLPDWAQTLIRDTRAEAGKSRTNAKQTAADEARQAVLDEFAVKLGYKKGETDPAKLTEQLNDERDTARQARVELSVFRRAAKHDGDPDALLDSRQFQASIAELDPAAADFEAKVEAAIKTAVKDNPKLKKTAPAASGPSGGQFGGGPGGPPKKAGSLEDAVAARLGAQ